MNNYNLESPEEYLLPIYEEAKYSSPCEIARKHNLEVKEEDLPCATIGIYTRIGERFFILVNNSDTIEMQQYAIALCLYYHFEGRPRILLRSGPVDGDYSAGHFAYQLHLMSRVGFKIPAEIAERAKGLLN